MGEPPASTPSRALSLFCAAQSTRSSSIPLSVAFTPPLSAMRAFAQRARWSRSLALRQSRSSGSLLIERALPNKALKLTRPCCGLTTCGTVLAVKLGRLVPGQPAGRAA